MSHTPGPWKWTGTGNLASSDGRMVLAGNGSFAPDVPMDEDRRLIAAAPDLLAAIKDAVADYEASTPDYWPNFIDTFRELIASVEAEGTDDGD